MARCTSICAKNSWCTGTKGCIPQQEVLLVYYSWHKELAPCNCFKSGYHWVHFMVLWSHNRRESKESSPFVLLMGCRPLPSCTGTLHPLIILTFHTLFQSQHLPQKRWWSKLCLEYQLWKTTGLYSSKMMWFLKLIYFSFLIIPCVLSGFLTATKVMFSFIYQNSRGFLCSSNDHLRACILHNYKIRFSWRTFLYTLSMQNFTCLFCPTIQTCQTFFCQKQKYCTPSNYFACFSFSINYFLL